MRKKTRLSGRDLRSSSSLGAVLLSEIESFPWRKDSLPPGDRVLFVLEGLFVRDRQFFAALLPAGSQHSAAVGRSHPFTESVLVLSLSAGRLVGAFHGREN